MGIAVHVPGPNDSTLRYDVLWNGTSWSDTTLCASIPETYIPEALWEQGSFSEMDLYRCFSVDEFINQTQKIDAAPYENVFSAAMLDLRGKSFIGSLQIRAMGGGLPRGTKRHR